MRSTRIMGGSAVALTIILVGCRLDVVGTGAFGTDDDGGTAGPADATASTASDGAPTTPDSAAGADAPVGYDAASTYDSAPPCDLDGDGHKSTACGGDDCCDKDARVHPGATDWQPGPAACGGYDYDCNGTEEKQVGVANCHVTIGCQGTGFDQDTPCGAQAGHTWCLGLVMCNQVHDTQTQQCR